MTFEDEAEAVESWDVVASKQVEDFQRVAKKWRFDAKVRSHTESAAVAIRLNTKMAGLDVAADKKIAELSKEHAMKVNSLQRKVRDTQAELAKMEDTHPNIVLQVHATVRSDRAAIRTKLAALPTTTVSITSPPYAFPRR
jgi:hypothetical protein